MVAQLDANLDSSLDPEAPPTIYGTPITPELCTGSLNLCVDFQRHRHSLATSSVIQSVQTALYVFIVISGFVLYNSWQHLQIEGARALWTHGNWGNSVIFITMFIGAYIKIVSTTTVSIEKRANSVVDRQEEVFGFDLKVMAAIGEDQKKFSKDQKQAKEAAKNTQVIVYRSTPIAMVCVKEEKVDSPHFTVKISALGARKVYQRSGIIDDLLRWAAIRSRMMLQESGEQKTSIRLLIDVYSFDKELTKRVKARNFQLVDKKPLPGMLGKFYRATENTWVLPLSTLPAEVVSAAKEDKKVRKRKA